MLILPAHILFEMFWRSPLKHYMDCVLILPAQMWSSLWTSSLRCFEEVHHLQQLMVSPKIWFPDAKPIICYLSICFSVGLTVDYLALRSVFLIFLSNLDSNLVFSSCLYYPKFCAGGRQCLQWGLEFRTCSWPGPKGHIGPEKVLIPLQIPENALAALLPIGMGT